MRDATGGGSGRLVSAPGNEVAVGAVLQPCQPVQQLVKDGVAEVAPAPAPPELVEVGLQVRPAKPWKVPLPPRLSSEDSRCAHGISTWAAILPTTLGWWAYSPASARQAGRPSVSRPDFGATGPRTKAPIFSPE